MLIKHVSNCVPWHVIARVARWCCVMARVVSWCLACCKAFKVGIIMTQFFTLSLDQGKGEVYTRSTILQGAPRGRGHPRGTSPAVQPRGTLGGPLERNVALLDGDEGTARQLNIVR